jgi:hypothetical protein
MNKSELIVILLRETNVALFRMCTDHSCLAWLSQLGR